MFWRFRSVAVIGLLAAAIVSVWWLPGLPRPAGSLARHIRAQVLEQTADESQVERLVGQLPNLGEPGMEVLTELAVTARPSTASHARRVLEQQMRLWQRWPLDDSTRAVARLLSQLVQLNEQMTLDGKQFAARVAVQILKWPLDPQAARRLEGGSVRIVADCQQLLEQAAAARIDAAIAGLSTAPPDQEDTPARQVLDATQDSPETARNEASSDLAATPGRELAVEAAGDGSAPPAIRPEVPAPAQPSSADRTEPPPLVVGRAARPLPVDPRSGATGQAPEDVQEQAGSRLSRNRFAARTADQLRELSDLELMRRLNAPDASVAISASEELERRGFRAEHLSLAERLTHPDPQVRIELVSQLLRIRGISPATWLLQLSRDEHPAVRRAAAAVMATSTDPRLWQRLREMQLEEHDLTLREMLRNQTR